MNFSIKKIEYTRIGLRRKKNVKFEISKEKNMNVHYLNIFFCIIINNLKEKKYNNNNKNHKNQNLNLFHNPCGLWLHTETSDDDGYMVCSVSIV